jgi:hypothetical protein
MVDQAKALLRCEEELTQYARSRAAAAPLQRLLLEWLRHKFVTVDQDTQTRGQGSVAGRAGVVARVRCECADDRCGFRVAARSRAL